MCRLSRLLPSYRFKLLKLLNGTAYALVNGMKTKLTQCARSMLLAAIVLPSVACAVEGERPASLDAQLLPETCELGELQSCYPGDPALGGEQECLEFDDGSLGWGECESYVPQCDASDQPNAYSTWNGSCCENMYGCCLGEACNTPLVLAFDNQRVSYHRHMSGSFDLTGKDMSLASDWPTATTPWLALDRDGDGQINSGAELFGSATRLSSGQHARHGFEALRDLDSNHDGRIDARDSAWSKLRLWHDRDASRSSSSTELTSLARNELLWIGLDFHRDIRCDLRGNCEGERAQFAYLDANGEERIGTVIDVYLRGR